MIIIIIQEGIQLPNAEEIGEADVEGYKYLGVLGLDKNNV